KPIEMRRRWQNRLVVPQTEEILASGDNRFGVVAVDLVAGKLLAEKAVVGLVVVEALDDVVAVTPDERLGTIALVTIGLGIADQVEPVASPLFAVMRRGEQPINQPLVGIRRIVFQESVDLFGRRGKAGQVVSDTADQGDAVSGRARCQPLRFEPREDEGIDRPSYPRPVLDRGNSRAPDGTIGPVVL